VSRKIDVDLQSPGLARSAAGSYITQVNAIDDPDVRRVLMPAKGEHIHHKAILKTLTPLYKGLSESEAAELTAHLNQYGGIGNHIQNLIPMPASTHQGGIHPMAKGFGYEYHPNKKEQVGFVQDIMEASELPLAYRKHVGEQYLKKAVPDMNNFINDLLTEAYRKAGDKLNISPQMMEGMRARDINKMQTQGVVLGNVINK
tara:strand:+ start:1019 stop:1621 length:603 start_codon:yes stop_codon:yes gene_type:complete